jgi:peptidoglycan/xylan/chitin deacetylase (PgdA/CDA1 family)
MYHYVRVNPEPRDSLGAALSVAPSDFAAQMDWLAQSGYHPITLDDLYAFLSGARGLPSRPIVLTFDDGYADFYYAALPVLRSHDFKAVTYVVSGFMGRPGYMSSAQVAEADRTGIQIGSHTVDHPNLTRQSFGSLGYELAASKQSLEQLLGHPVLSFCYPSGRFNPRVMSAVQAAGYQDATTTQFGSVRTLAGRYSWGRLRVSGGENLQQFAAGVLSAS